jgi:ribokinase
MKVINFGSLNFDHVYEVEHFVQPGETITAKNYQRLCGGKGLNQSIALARAGAQVFHAGKVGRDGEPLIACLKSAGVDTTHVGIIESKPSGHAVIQVDRHGQNSIIIHGGANREIQIEDAERVLGQFSVGDFLVLQNEISSISEIVRRAKKQGLTIFLNPAPMDKTVLNYPLDLVDYFIINRIEGRELARSPFSRWASMASFMPISRQASPFLRRKSRRLTPLRPGILSLVILSLKRSRGRQSKIV